MRSGGGASVMSVGACATSAGSVGLVERLPAANSTLLVLTLRLTRAVPSSPVQGLGSRRPLRYRPVPLVRYGRIFSELPKRLTLYQFCFSPLRLNSLEQIEKEMAEAGYTRVAQHDFLPRQHFLIFARR